MYKISTILKGHNPKRLIKYLYKLNIQHVCTITWVSIVLLIALILYGYVKLFITLF
jgi:hypothetical protein